MAAGIIHAVKLESTSVNNVFTISGFTPPAGSNKRIGVLVLGARAAGNTLARTVSSVVWNSVSFNSRAQATSSTGTGVRAAFLDLAIGDSTVSSNLTVTLNNAVQGCIVHAFVIEDVEQGTPTPTAISSNNLSDAITLSALGIAIDLLTNCSNNAAGDFSLTSASQTQTSLSPSRTFAGTTNEQNLGSSYAVGSGSLSLGWTAAASPNRAHVIVGYLQASSSGGGTTPTPTSSTIAGVAILSAAPRALARTAAALAGTGSLAAAPIARARTAVAAAGAASVASTAQAAARAALALSGTASLAAAAQAAARAEAALSGSSSLGAAAQARALTAAALAGTSTMTIALGTTELVPTAARTFSSAGQPRTYSREGSPRIFVLDRRQRTFP